MDNKILVSILTHRCQCPHDRLKRGGDRGGATHIHKRKLSSEPHVKKGYKWRNHLFYTPGSGVWTLLLLNIYFDHETQQLVELFICYDVNSRT
jgi:hypothetical protein